MYPVNGEPPIDELLFDPLVRMRMRRAGIAPEAVEGLLREIKRRLDGEDGAASNRGTHL